MSQRRHKVRIHPHAAERMASAGRRKRRSLLRHWRRAVPARFGRTGFRRDFALEASGGKAFLDQADRGLRRERKRMARDYGCGKVLLSWE